MIAPPIVVFKSDWLTVQITDPRAMNPEGVRAVLALLAKAGSPAGRIAPEDAPARLKPSGQAPAIVMGRFDRPRLWQVLSQAGVSQHGLADRPDLVPVIWAELTRRCGNTEAR